MPVEAYSSMGREKFRARHLSITRGYVENRRAGCDAVGAVGRTLKDRRGVAGREDAELGGCRNIDSVLRPLWSAPLMHSVSAASSPLSHVEAL